MKRSVAKINELRLDECNVSGKAGDYNQRVGSGN